MIRRGSKSEAGFTIVELMVATMVFSTIMLIITFGVLQFSKSYYRGVVSSSTQTATRTAVDDISQAIQFSGNDLKQNPTNDSFCIGNKVFTYNQNVLLASDGSNHALYVTPAGLGTSTDPPGTVCPKISFYTDPTNSANNSQEYLSSNMRVVKFTINNSGQDYTIDLKVAYGSDQVLCSPSAPVGTGNDCTVDNNPAHATALNNTDLRCRGGQDTQFCAVSELITTVQRRLQ